jgi:Flp pilus assembly pilin Flp
MTSSTVSSTGRLVPSGRYERAINLSNPKEHSMLKVFAFLQNVLAEPVRRDDRGVTAVEYALLLTMIGAVLIGAVVIFGNLLSGVFGNFKF